MPIIVKRKDDEGNEAWMCGNCFGFVAPSRAVEVPTETPSGNEMRIPYCIPCTDSVDYKSTGA